MLALYGKQQMAVQAGLQCRFLLATAGECCLHWMQLMTILSGLHFHRLLTVCVCTNRPMAEAHGPISLLLLWIMSRLILYEVLQAPMAVFITVRTNRFFTATIQ